MVFHSKTYTLLFLFLVFSQSTISAKRSVAKPLTLVGKCFVKNTKDTLSSSYEFLKFESSNELIAHESKGSKTKQWKKSGKKLFVFEKNSSKKERFSVVGDKLVDDRGQVWKVAKDCTAELPTSNTWYVDKHFINNKPLSANPQEGGRDFLIIHKNHTAELKIGDMVQPATWHADNNTIYLTNPMTEKTMKMEIGHLILTDEYGTKWSIQ